MQIGADIYCDSQCIIRELDRRHPTPPFFPSPEAGLMWCLSRWTDGALFDLAVKVVLGSAGDDLPRDFAEDRGRLYLGPDWAEGLKAANADLPHLVSQLRAPFSWLEMQLQDGRKFLLGDAPAAIDAQIYYVIWFVHGRWDNGPALLSEFPHLQRWRETMLAMGHGTMTEMTPEAAIARAAECSPIAQSTSDANEPQGLSVGMLVVISPDVNGGEQPVEGRITGVDQETITVLRHEPDVGDIAVHFPRAGYRVDVP